MNNGELSILDANGAIACAECGRQARAVRDRLKAENDKLRELACHMLTCIRYMESPAFDENGCSFCKYDGKRVCNFEERMKALDIEAEE